MRLGEGSVAAPSFCEAPKAICGWARTEMPTVLHRLWTRLLGRRNLCLVCRSGGARPPVGAAGASALAAGGELGSLSPVLLPLNPCVESVGARVLLDAGRSVLNPGEYQKQPRGSAPRILQTRAATCFLRILGVGPPPMAVSEDPGNADSLSSATEALGLGGVSSGARSWSPVCNSAELIGGRARPPSFDPVGEFERPLAGPVSVPALDGGMGWTFLSFTGRPVLRIPPRFPAFRLARGSRR